MRKLVIQEEVRRAVREHYSQLAVTGRTPNCCSGSECCENVSSATADLPPEATALSAGCTSPVVFADIKEGETVLDLGSGGGIDVFRASKLVGEHGRVIGVDSTPEMVWRSMETARKHGYANVEFRLGEMEQLPLEGNVVDVVISNCAVNLSLDKTAVFREALRVLRPAGRLVVSDVVALEPIPHELTTDFKAWSSCISGTLEEKEYLSAIQHAGFVSPQILKRDTYSIVHSNTALRLGSALIVAFKPK